MNIGSQIDTTIAFVLFFFFFFLELFDFGLGFFFFSSGDFSSFALDFWIFRTKKWENPAGTRTPGTQPEG